MPEESPGRVSPSSRPVLVGVGDSDKPGDSDAALRYAAQLAVREGRPLQFAHVMRRPSPLFPEEMLISYEAVTLVAQDLAAAAAEKAERLTQGAVPITRTVRFGSRVPTLVALAAGAHEVVLQHHSRHGLARVASGSVVVGVAGRSEVPVVSVPDGWGEQAVAGQVAVAVDGHADNGRLLEEAFALASARRAGLTVVHAWFLGTAYDEAITSSTPLGQWSELARRQIVRHLEEVTGRYPDVEVRVQVRHERAADALVAVARHSDVLVVGRRDARHRHLGPVARAAVLECSCPVVVVPSGATGSVEPGDVAAGPAVVSS